MATIRFYDHGKCHCGTDDIQAGCQVTIWDAEMAEEGVEALKQSLIREARNG